MRDAPGISDGRALGTSLRVLTTDPGVVAAARAAVDRVLAEIDQSCSRFREDSELQALNRQPGKDVVVSPLLNRALEVALEAARRTEGAVDPTVGSPIRLAGYDRDFQSLPADGEPIRVTPQRVPGWQLIRHLPTVRKVRLPPGVELDLGATAKGLAADLAADAALAVAGTGGVLVSLGGDIAVAGEPWPGGWSVQISEDSGAPIEAGEETVAIVAGGLATSSTTVRRWRRGGVELHHIIDPATGLPAESPWRTVTVHSRSCVEANTASTAAIVMGNRALAWLGEAAIPARLVGRDGAVVRVGGWPAHS